MYLIQGQRTLAGCNVVAADLSHSGHRLCAAPGNGAHFGPLGRNLAKPDLRNQPWVEMKPGAPGPTRRINRLRRLVDPA
jgi:hypothetical protein